MNELKDKIVVIAGASRGIGLATAKKMREEGAFVYACSRSECNFEDEGILWHYLDVTDPQSCKKLFDDVLENSGKADILICNAGITKDSMTRKMNDDTFDLVIDTNLKGVFNLVRHFGPKMEEQGFGSIIAISSVVAEQGNIGQANYAASKAGLIGMCRSWAKEFSRKGSQVRVNVVAPGYTHTDMLKSVPENLLEQFRSRTMLKRLGEPEEIADVICFLASDRASYITGAEIPIAGGWQL